MEERMKTLEDLVQKFQKKMEDQNKLMQMLIQQAGGADLSINGY